MLNKYITSIVVSAGVTLAAEPPAVTAITAFEKAMHLELVEKKPAAAAALYEKLTGADNPAEIREAAAKRLANCVPPKNTPAVGANQKATEKEMPPKVVTPESEAMSLFNQAFEICATSGATLRDEPLIAALDEMAKSLGDDATYRRFEVPAKSSPRRVFIDAFQYCASLKGTNREALYKAAFNGVAKSLSENAYYMSPEDYAAMEKDIIDSQIGIGVMIDPDVASGAKINGVVPDSPAHRAGLTLGTEILEIDGKTIFALGTKLQDVVKAIRGPLNTAVSLKVKLPGGETQVMSIDRERITYKEQPSCRPLLGDKKPATYWVDEAAGIAGVAFNGFTNKTVSDFSGILKDPTFQKTPIRGLIIDLCDNGGGYLPQAEELADLFLNAGRISFRKTRKDGAVPKFATSGQVLEGVPIVVLVNGKTASAAEVFAAAMQDNRRATIMGQRTYGRGEILQPKSFNGNAAFMAPVMELLRANGKALEHRPGMTEKDDWGVVPDKVVVTPGMGLGIKDQTAREILVGNAVEHIKSVNAKQ